MTLIIEIALGIALGVLILAFLPAILALGVAALIVAVVLVVVAVLVAFARTTPEAIVIPLALFGVGALAWLLFRLVRIYRSDSEILAPESPAPNSKFAVNPPSWREMGLVGKAIVVIWFALIAALLMTPVWRHLSSLFS